MYVEIYRLNGEFFINGGGKCRDERRCGNLCPLHDVLITGSGTIFNGSRLNNIDWVRFWKIRRTRNYRITCSYDPYGLGEGDGFVSLLRLKG